MPLGLEDIRLVDAYRYSMLQQVLSHSYSCSFAVDLGSGEEIDLCPGGSEIQVTPENSKRFVDLFVSKYFEQSQLEVDSVIEGIKMTCKAGILSCLTP